MSLLMDALRKAEEEKKKAEQENQEAAKTSTGDASPTEAAPAEQAQVVEPVEEPETVEFESEPATPEPEHVDDAESESGDSGSDFQHVDSPIPDVTLEFDESEEELSTQTAQQSEASDEESSTETESAAGSLSEAESDGLSLEPIDYSLSGATRKPFEDDGTPDYSAESPLVALSRQATETTSNEKQTADYPQVKPEPLPAATALNTDSEDLPEYVPQPPEDPEKAAEPAAEVKSDSAIDRKAKSDLKLTPKRSTLSERSEPERRAARSMFAAKRKGGGKRRFRMRRSQRIWALQIVAGLVVAIGVAYYFLATGSGSNDFNVPQEFLANQSSYSDQFNESLADGEITDAPVALDSFTETSSPTDENTVAVAESPLDQLATETSQTAVTAEPALTESTLADEIVEMPIPEQEPVETVQVVTTEVETSPNDIAMQDTVASSDEAANQPIEQEPVNLISFSRRQTPTAIDPNLQNAYSAFQRDDLVTAQALYQQVLQESPRQRDALLGLAAIAVRNGESSLAMELYSRLLARDPSDSVAQAGLLGVRPSGGPEQQEQNLRRLVDQQPEVAPVIYALGNFYASQGRWNEAQRSYFDALQQAKSDALQGVPVNPDYAFNLAVSLERLNQVSPAQTYYREAIVYAENAPASFDVGIARNRLSSLAGN